VLPEEIQKEWQELCKPSGAPGKQARKNAIVNAAVPRDADYKSGIVVAERTFAKIITAAEEKTREGKEEGIDIFLAKAKYGAYFDDAVASGAIWEEDGFWYSGSRIRKRTNTYSEEQQLNAKGGIGDSQFLSGHLALRGESGDAWLQISDKQRGTSSDDKHQTLASDELMARLQESFDATSALMRSVKKASHELMQAAQVTESGMEMVRMSSPIYSHCKRECVGWHCLTSCSVLNYLLRTSLRTETKFTAIDQLSTTT
jgi:hypothetical protein